MELPAVAFHLTLYNESIDNPPGLYPAFILRWYPVAPCQTPPVQTMTLSRTCPPFGKKSRFLIRKSTSPVEPPQAGTLLRAGLPKKN